MTIRPFEWRDLPVLHSYRNECVYLDCTRVLTSGPIFVPAGSLLSTLSPATGLYTYRYQQPAAGEPALFGQIAHTQGSSSAHLTFLSPGYALHTALLAPLIEQLAQPVGELGAMHLVAEVEDPSPALDALRLATFGIYARQRVWQLRITEGEERSFGLWRSATPRDEAAIRFLYASLVPGLVQQVEALPAGRLRGLVYYRGTELLAYVDIISGMGGVYALPIIHPDAEAIAEQLVRILQHLPSWRSRPLYVAVRSYQSWMEAVLHELGAIPGPQQAVIVKRMVVRRSAPASAIPVLNGAATEPT